MHSFDVRAALRCATTFVLCGVISAVAAAEDVPARKTTFGNYDQCVEMRIGDAGVLLSPQAGGRVLQFWFLGSQSLYLDEQELQWRRGAKPAAITAGRFDYGPELVVKPHPRIWSGDWTAEIVGSFEVRMTSPRDEAAGMQVVRTFTLAPTDGDPARTSAILRCKQTLKNIGEAPQDVCHWGRSFSHGEGIVLIPLGAEPSRFPSKYAMYEDSAVINVRNVDPLIREREGFLEILGAPRKPKLGFDSYAGRLGYLMPGNLLLIKRFATDPNRVYNEAAGLTLSVWYPQGPRVELEPIGPRERLAAGAEASFTEEWQLAKFPFPKSGEQVDLEAVRKLLK